MLEIQGMHRDTLVNSSERVATGSRVRLLDVDESTEWEVMIVSSDEADPDADRISDRCPIGEALLGRMAGDVVQVDVPLGTVLYRVLSVSPPAPEVIGVDAWQPAMPARAEMEEP